MNSLIKENPLVSIIVPVYNVEKYLPKCLESLINQTYQNLEIIAVNDGSPDNCKSILEEYAKKDCRIKVFNKENGGVSSARNVALDKLLGEYVIMVDSDDYVSKDYIQLLMEYLQSENADISACPYLIVEENQEIEETKEINRNVFNKEQMISALFKNNPYTGSLCNKLIKAELLKDIRFNEKLKHYEDYDFLYKVFKRAERLVYIDKAMYFYVIRQGSAAHSKFSTAQTVITDVIDYMYKDVLVNFKNIKKVAFTERIRTYLMVATLVKQNGYVDKPYRKKLKKSVRRGLIKFLFSYAALGYKLKAIRLSLGFKFFK